MKGRASAALLAVAPPVVRGVAALLACLCLSSLGAQVPPSPDAGLQMVAWCDADQRLPPGLHDLLTGYAEDHRGMRVNVTYDRWPQAPVRLRYWLGSLRQYAPDITILRDVWLPLYASSLLPLEGHVTDKDLSGLVPSAVGRCRVGGKLLGVPWRMATRALYYRHDLFEKARLSPPTSLTELAKAARKLSQPPRVHGLGLSAQPGGEAAEVLLALLAAYGGRAVDEAGNLQLTSAEAARALRYWTELARAGATPPEALSWSNAELQEAFAQGKLAMVIAGPELGKTLKGRHPELAVGVCAMPQDVARATLVSCEVAVAMGQTQRPRECGEFLRFLTGPQAQRALWMMGELPVARGDIAEARQFANLAPFLEQVETAGGRPMERGDEVVLALDHAIWLALSGRAEPDAALAQAAAALKPAEE